METKIEYKGYIIEAKPDELANNKGWTTEAYITKKFNDIQIITKQFSATNIFKTKEKGIKFSLLYGKQIIDGQVTDLDPIETYFNI
ncbi:CV_2116 domain-containing protein [Candidatus Riflebacteria bacterium]